jgi:3-oxoacyl-[acyl-carrier protein] reductase/meso-butanediol dehydrogenase/(S,S)-butanediol dehydrogenase/diacetyl reductase
LAGKVAVVTGAARHRGIGRAIALRLAEEGCDVVVSGRRRAPSSLPAHEQAMGWRGVASVADEIEALGRGALGLDCDVTRRDEVQAMVDATVERFGRIDVVVNNAGVPSEAGAAPVLDMDDDTWYSTVDVNLHGVYLVTKAAGRVMRDGGRGGSIVMISSMAGRQGLPNYGAYCASKWAVIGLTQQLAVELAPAGIRVNCVCPGSTDTDMMDGTFGRTAARFGLDPEAPRRGAIARIPLGRQGDVREQAAAVAFLVSDDAGYITGQTLNVDGGLRMD